MINDLSFVCVAVRDIQEATDRYRDLFDLQVMVPPSDNTELGFRSTYLGNGAVVIIELIEPLGEDSAVGRFLEARGEGVYLITFEVEDLKGAVKDVRAKGGRVTGIPEDQEANAGDMVWVHPKSAHGVFIELLQKGHGPMDGGA